MTITTTKLTRVAGLAAVAAGQLFCRAVPCPRRDALGSFRFSPGLRSRRPGWHRASGRVVVALGLVVALTGSQLFFRLVAAAYERRSLGIASHWPFEDWGRFLPEHTTAVSLLDRLLHHSVVVATHGESFRMKQARSKGGLLTHTNG